MAETIGNNKRLAKNTLILYVRMFLMMAVTLYTSRVTLKALGITDYGIYSVVSGFVAMFSVVSGAMSVAISRYISIWVGKDNKKILREVFSTSIIIQVIVAILICVALEIIGIWFLNNKFVIPPDRLFSAHWVLQSSIIAFVIGLINVPYNAVIIAHERMSAFAYISILDAVLKLSIAYIISISSFDRLIVYAILMAMLSLCMRFVYMFYCNRKFEESHFKMVFNKSMLKDMAQFIGWAFWGNAVWTIREYGTNIMFNIFIGPVVNAARGIASQVNTASYGFVSNFLTAVNPQITKSYSKSEIGNMNMLISRSSRFGMFILLMLLVPICANIDYILSLWLVEVPEHTSSFVVLILISSLFSCVSQPLLYGVLAQGDIKSYEIVLTILYVINIGVCYYILRIGFEPEWCFVTNIAFDLLVIAKLLQHSKVKYGFPVGDFFKLNIIHTVPVLCLCVLFVVFVPVTNADSVVSLIVDSVILVVFTGLCIMMIGVTASERKYIINQIKNKIQNVHN